MAEAIGQWCFHVFEVIVAAAVVGWRSTIMLMPELAYLLKMLLMMAKSRAIVANCVTLTHRRLLLLLELLCWPTMRHVWLWRWCGYIQWHQIRFSTLHFHFTAIIQEECR